MALRTIIVEDEPLSRTFLDNLLSEFCPGVEVVARAASEDEAVQRIAELKPDLVFLDIELHQGTGFGVLQRTDIPGLHIIFTTAYDHYALKAIRFSGAGYLSKPIDIEALQEMIGKICQNQDQSADQSAIKHLVQTLNNNNTPLHIAVQANGTTEYLPLAEIISLEARNDGIDFVLADRRVAVAGNLKEIGSLMTEYGFFRTHQSHLVNLKAICSVKEETVLMNDGSEVPLSARKKDELLELIS